MCRVKNICRWVGNGFCTGTFTPCPHNFKLQPLPKVFGEIKIQERKFLIISNLLLDDDVESGI